MRVSSARLGAVGPARLSDGHADRAWGTPRFTENWGVQSHHIGLVGEGPGASQEERGPTFSRRARVPWNLSIFSR